MQKILVTGSLQPDAKQRLEKAGLSITTYGVHDLEDEKEFAKAIKGFDIYLSGGYEKASAAVLNEADKLKLIAFLGVECGAFIDIPVASEKGIKVCNTPGANAVSVSEFAVGLMIDAQRRLTASAFSALQGDGSYVPSKTLYGKTVGLVGMGPIGVRIASMCSMGLSTDVAYWTRSGEKTSAKAFGARAVGLDELIQVSDIICIQIPTGAGTLFDERAFSLMKPGATIVNVSAARLIDPKALLQALKRDEFLYVAYDSFYDKLEETEEPAIGQLRTFAPKQLLITPHVAWRTIESERSTYAMALKSIEEFVNGQTPSNLVN